MAASPFYGRPTSPLYGRYKNTVSSLYGRYTTTSIVRSIHKNLHRYTHTFTMWSIHQYLHYNTFQKKSKSKASLFFSFLEPFLSCFCLSEPATTTGLCLLALLFFKSSNSFNILLS